MSPQPTVVWTEIPVTDLARSTEFYNAIFLWGMEPSTMGPEEIAAFGMEGIGGNLVKGPVGNGTGNIIYLNAPGGLEAAKSRAEAAGAKFEGTEMTIPPGRYVVMLDPDGNRIGLFEPKAA
ncbi:VOC family protein [Pseudoruegeria sp. HB172150]|uniref:VOC family protein n=1 Tax=Pseudoruegeria sp. HB172150 TaxID=2721164 RepID=UPI0015563D0D|nr:VOC family protein [Pseudoruegeria sp. HB172150]